MRCITTSRFIEYLDEALTNILLTIRTPDGEIREKAIRTKEDVEFVKGALDGLLEDLGAPRQEPVGGARRLVHEADVKAFQENFTPADVAQWMEHELMSGPRLFQSHVVFEVRKRFGKQFVYQNKSGGESIATNVLREFRKLTNTKAVWSKSEKCWRMRRETDDPGKRRVY